MSLEHIVAKRKRQKRKGKEDSRNGKRQEQASQNLQYTLSINISKDRRFQHIEYKGSLMSVSCFKGAQ